MYTTLNGRYKAGRLPCNLCESLPTSQRVKLFEPAIFSTQNKDGAELREETDRTQPIMASKTTKRLLSKRFLKRYFLKEVLIILLIILFVAFNCRGIGQPAKETASGT